MPGARQERHYAFADLAVLRQASAELARGVPFRAVVRNLVAERQGQLALDFQASGETTPAKVITLPAREPRTAAVSSASRPDEQALELATAYFAEGAELDSGTTPSSGTRRWTRIGGRWRSIRR